MGVRVILEEIGEDYELIPSEIDMDKPRSAEFLALNPNGWVPVLISEQGAIYECAAITTFLCDRYPEFELAPGANDHERGLFLQWLVYFASSVQNAFQMSYYPFRFCDSEEDYPGVQRRAISRLREVWRVVDDAIGDSDWLLGERFSAADIYLFMLTTWLSAERSHPRTDEFPNIHRVALKVMQRPSVQKVFTDYIENLPG
jgi:glutathione S-transferase